MPGGSELRPQAFLRGSAKRHRNGFQFCVIGQSGLAQFAPEAAHLETAKRCSRIEDIVAVDPHRTGAEFVCQRVGFCPVSAPDCGSQTVAGVICSQCDFVEVPELQDAHHGPEDFFPGDIHLICHAGEYRRLDEVAFVADAVASSNTGSALAASATDIAHDLVELSLINLRSLFGALIERVANSAFARSGHHFCHEFIVHRFFHEQPAAGTAALALIEEQPELRTGRCCVEVGIGEDDVGALAAQFKGEPFERF